MKKRPIKNMQLWWIEPTNTLYLIDLNRPNDPAEVLFGWAHSWMPSLLMLNRPFSNNYFTLIGEWSDS